MKPTTQELGIACSDCVEFFEPDQYSTFCNECGPRHDNEFFTEFAGVDENGFMYFRKK